MKKTKWEDIERKTKELVELIKNYDESKAEAATWVCTEIVILSCDTYFETLGVFIDLFLSYREDCMKTLDGGDDDESK